MAQIKIVSASCINDKDGETININYKKDEGSLLNIFCLTTNIASLTEEEKAVIDICFKKEYENTLDLPSTYINISRIVFVNEVNSFYIQNPDGTWQTI